VCECRDGWWNSGKRVRSGTPRNEACSVEPKKDLINGWEQLSRKANASRKLVPAVLPYKQYMISEREAEQAKMVLPMGDQVFHILLRWKIVALVIAFGVPYAIWQLVSNGSFIPAGMHYIQDIIVAICYGIAACGLFFFSTTFQWLRVNQAGVQYSKFFAVKAMPWDELLAYDVSLPLNTIDVLDIRARKIHVNCNLFEYGMVEKLKAYAIENHKRAFQHIDNRGLKCAVRSRLHWGIFTILFCCGSWIGLVTMGQNFAPTLAYQIIVYNGAQAICLFATLAAIYHITATLKIDRFGITRRAILTKEHISFSQVTAITISYRILESETPIEVMDIAGKGGTKIRITEHARSYKLIRDYIIAKSALAKVSGRVLS